MILATVVDNNTQNKVLTNVKTLFFKIRKYIGAIEAQPAEHRCSQLYLHYIYIFNHVENSFKQLKQLK